MSGSEKKQSSSISSAGDQTSHDTGADLGAAATETKDQIKEQVGGLTDQVRQQATHQISSQKDRVVETLDTVALLLRQAGEHATKDDKAMLAGYVDRASERVGQWSEKLRDEDATQLLEETKQLARREPLLFFSGALAAGFVASRFLRSSAQQVEQAPQDDSSTGSQTPGSGGSAADRETSSPAFNDAALDTPLAADMALESEMTPEGGSFADDDDAVTLPDPLDTLNPLEADEFEITTLVDLDELTRPEKL